MKPRIEACPAGRSNLGTQAVELAASAGLVLDDWQQHCLKRSLREKAGKWTSFEVGLCLPRQNGKDAILEARELAALFLVDTDRLTIHSAHMFDTSLEHFWRLLWLIENTDDLRKKVLKVTRSHGEEGITLRDGSRIRFRTRTKGGGRGFSCDLLIYNEAMMIAENSHGALLPTLSARPNPQVWYAGSAVDQLVHDDGIVFARARERGIEKGDRLAFFEWSLDRDNPEQVEPELADDQKAWKEANPAMGIRITPQHVSDERRSMDDRTFAVERLNVGDWPSTVRGSGMIEAERWAELADGLSEPLEPVCFAFDVSADRQWSTVAVAGLRSDGLFHVELAERKSGTAWVVPWLEERAERWAPAMIVRDSRGPSTSLVRALEATGLEITETNTSQYAGACGLIADLARDGRLRHRSQAALNAAVRGAQTRTLGDAWVWSRASSGVDVAPLIAATLALWAAETAAASSWDSRGLIAV